MAALKELCFDSERGCMTTKFNVINSSSYCFSPPSAGGAASSMFSLLQRGLIARARTKNTQFL
jgi:hypothetical protein